MSLTIVLKSYAAPGNIDEYANVQTAGGQNTNTGTKATDLTNFQTAAQAAASGTGGLLNITYVDGAGATQTRLIGVSDIKTVL